MAPSVSAYVPASSRRRPLISRRAHSSHGATRVSFTACSTVAISGGLRCCSAAYFRSFHRSPRSDRACGNSGAARLALQRHIDAEVRADLIAEHAADAVVLVGDDHREPSDLVGGRSPREDVGRAHAEAEPAGLAHVLTDDDVPLAGGPARRLLLKLEQRHPCLPERWPSPRSPWRWRCEPGPAARRALRPRRRWRRGSHDARGRRRPGDAAWGATPGGSAGW